MKKAIALLTLIFFLSSMICFAQAQKVVPCEPTKSKPVAKKIVTPPPAKEKVYTLEELSKIKQVLVPEQASVPVAPPAPVYIQPPAPTQTFTPATPSAFEAFMKWQLMKEMRDDKTKQNLAQSNSAQTNEEILAEMKRQTTELEKQTKIQQSTNKWTKVGVVVNGVTAVSTTVTAVRMGGLRKDIQNLQGELGRPNIIQTVTTSATSADASNSNTNSSSSNPTLNNTNTSNPTLNNTSNPSINGSGNSSSQSNPTVNPTITANGGAGGQGGRGGEGGQGGSSSSQGGSSTSTSQGGNVTGSGNSSSNSKSEKHPRGASSSVA